MRKYRIETVRKDTRIPGTNVILEAGEQIRVFEQNKKNDKKDDKNSMKDIMAKVSKGMDLSDTERKHVSAAVDAAKKGEDDDDKKGALGKIMTKVSKGQELSSDEEKILGSALKAAESYFKNRYTKKV